MTTRLTPSELLQKVEAIFRRAGVSDVQAAAISRVIVAGERDACKSHGIYRIGGLLRTLKANKVDGKAVPVLAPADETAIVRVNAGGGFSNSAFELGLPALVQKAQQMGIAALVVNDCTHFAALWPEVEAVAALGLVAMAMCPSYASVAPFGGSQALFGTNPFAFAWPREARDPFVFDFATSVAARGEIELHRRAGKAIPEGWAIDAAGKPTTDPASALAGAMLPFGGHKGSAIGAMIELLGAILIGDRTSAEAFAHLGSMTLLPRHGEIIIAFSPEKFSAGRDGKLVERAEVLFDAILGQGARLPSQRRFTARANAEREGIELTGAETSELDRFLQHGLDAVAL